MTADRRWCLVGGAAGIISGFGAAASHRGILAFAGAGAGAANLLLFWWLP